MTVEEYILGRSVLPQDGTHTLLEHLQSVTFTMYGEIRELIVDSTVDTVPTSSIVDKVTVSSKSSDVRVAEINNEVIIKEIVDE